MIKFQLKKYIIYNLDHSIHSIYFRCKICVTDVKTFLFIFIFLENRIISENFAKK